MTVRSRWAIVKTVLSANSLCFALLATSFNKETDRSHCRMVFPISSSVA